MDKPTAKRCVKNRRYLEAANFIIKEILRERIHSLNNRARDAITRKVALRRRQKHRVLVQMKRDILPPQEIADEIFEQVFAKASNRS